MAGLTKRGDTYHLRMRRPKRYANIDPKTEIHRSLKTRDKSIALQRLPVVEARILAELDAKLAGVGLPGSRSHYEALARYSSALGFVYRPAMELAKEPTEELLRRVEKVMEIDGDKSHESQAAAALLGGVDRPQITLGDVALRMPEFYPEELRDKNPKQKQVWHARWLRPVTKVIELIGRDPVLDQISRDDGISFRDALKDRVLEDDMKGESAQKDLQNLNLLWRKYHLHLGIDSIAIPSSPFKGLGDGMARLDEEGRKDEVPIHTLEGLVQTGALDFMNEELRDLVLVLVETGARQSEITDIAPDYIHLDEEIPYISIRRQKGEFARELKNKTSARDIPLVGVALEAMKRHPDGFPRYRGKGTFSAAANKILREKEILPEGVTIGGLRHSFDKRMDNANVKNEHVAQLMGHSRKKIRGREVYGNDVTLEQRLAYHQLIMIQPRLSLPAPSRQLVHQTNGPDNVTAPPTA